MNSALKDRLLTYSKLMRVDRPIGTLLLLWPTLWGLWVASNGHPSLKMLLIFIFGTFLTRSAGCVINDYADRHIDQHVERTRQRPFAQQAVTRQEALLLASGLGILALLLIISLNGLTLFLSIIAALIAISYPYTKRFFPLPQAYLGIAFSFGIPMAFSAVQAHIPKTAWLMMLATACWIIAYDTAYALVDKPDDVKLGIHSSAITFGRHVTMAIMLFHTAFLVLMGSVGWIIALGVPYFMGLVMATILIAKQYPDIRSGNRIRCFNAFLSNNRVGGVLFIGIVMDYLLSNKPV